MLKTVVAGLVVAGLVTIGQAQDMKEKAKQPARAPAAGVKAVTAPATKAVPEMKEAAGKEAVMKEKEAAVKETGTVLKKGEGAGKEIKTKAAGAKDEMMEKGKAAKVPRHPGKKGQESQEPAKK